MQSTSLDPEDPGLNKAQSHGASSFQGGARQQRILGNDTCHDEKDRGALYTVGATGGRMVWERPLSECAISAESWVIYPHKNVLHFTYGTVFVETST